MKMTGPEGLGEFADECASTLFDGSSIQFHYPDGCNLTNWPIAKIITLNDEFLKRLRSAGNVYALYTRRPNEAGSVAYVGQRKSEGLREKITQHLVSKNSRSDSMLAAVKTDVSDGREMTISLTYA